MVNDYAGGVTFTRRDISAVQADAVINFTNHRGSVKSQNEYVKSVANCMGPATLAAMNKYCRHAARTFAHIPSFIAGKKQGEFFTSRSYGLKCKEIIHVVSSFMSVEPISEKTAIIALNSVFKYCCDKGYRTVAMPYFMIKNHEFERDYIYPLIRKIASIYKNLSIIVTECL